MENADKQITSNISVHNNEIAVSLNASITGNTTVMIHDVQGKLLINNQFELKDESQFVFDKGQLKGLVLVTILCPESNLRETQRVVIQ